MNTPDPRYPFGVPTNRPPPPVKLFRIPGRPNWWRHVETGVESYIEPAAPAVPTLPPNA